MRTASKSPGKAMYVATTSDKEWLRSVQRKLYTRSKDNLDYVFAKLWGLVTDPRNLRVAFERVAGNKGRRTAGVDGETVHHVVQKGTEMFVAQVQAELRTKSYRPNPARRVLIPKTGQPGKFRPLGIPTVKDRVVQAAMKNMLEPIFEADFYPVSYGFRPGKSVFGALEHLRILLRPNDGFGKRTERRLAYQWAIEGDIRGCFDNIDHHALMVRIRRRVRDPKVNRLLVAFLKAGVMSEAQWSRTEAGTPQGGILSPLLANVALGVIEERYERHVWPRRNRTKQHKPTTAPERRAEAARGYDRACGRMVIYPIRYADDFILLVGAPSGPDEFDRAREAAHHEKASLAAYLKVAMNLELSESKTLVTPVTKPMLFLGHHVRVRHHPGHRRMVSTAVIPKERSQRLRHRIKALFHRYTLGTSLGDRLRQLNPILRGWSYFYRHAWGAKSVFGSLDHYVWWTIFRWLRKKHRRVPVRRLHALYRLPSPQGRRNTRWCDGAQVVFNMARVRVGPFELRWQRPPDFATHHGEPGA
jgi:RNA-directed DNA polymerase